MVCPRTYYKTQYHTVEVPETVVFTDCCEGYEQVGLYCSLALNRSSVFASRPGICPVENMETSDYPCTFDTECPGLKKCCNSSKGAGCVDPVPEGRTFWYNVTVLVKMDFNQLIRVDSHFLNHSRLLHSMITGALLPLNASVHHIQSNPAEVYAGTVTSQLLIGLHQPAALVEVSSSLKNIVKRVYEVIDTEVQDVNECSYAEFNACPKKNTCVNLEGYYSCAPQRAHIDVMQHQLSQRKEGIAVSTPSPALDLINTNYSSLSISNSSLLPITNQSTDAGCYPSAVRNHRVISVTSNSFEMSWHVTSTLNHTFQIQVFKGKEIVQNLKTEEMKMEVSQLEAGVMYSVEISYETCGKPSISHQNVKTEAKIFGVTLRILNYNFTEDFHNASSSAYEEFSRLLLTELENSFPPNISALYKSGKLKVEVESLQAGSIIVKLRITVQDHEIPVDASTFAPVLSYLHNDSTLLVDQQNSAVGDWDECASHAENDCSVFAECINLMGSYLCRCKTTMDTNPSRPGRNCEGEIVDPLTETMSPEITKSTAIAPEEVSSAGHASPATTEMVAAAGSEMSAAVHLPVTLPLDDKQVSHSHSPTSAPAASWKEGLTPGMGFGSASGPRTTGVTTSKEQATSSEQQETVSPSQQSSVADASPSASHPASAVTNTLMGTAGTADQEQLNTPSLVCQSQTATANTRSHTPFDVPQANFQGGPSTALPPTGDAGIPALNATLTAHVEMGRENSSWSEKYSAALWSPALSSSSPAPSPTPGPPTDRNVQKLRGTVRITNVKFSPGFSNTSSEEYQTFAQLFVDENVTDTIVKSILQNDDSAQGVIHRLKVSSPIHCVFQNHLLTSSGYTAEGLYTIFEDLHGSGHFRTEMQLFIGNSPIPKNFSVSASDDVLIEVGIQRADNKLKVVLTDCWATPSNNSVDPLSFTFISNSCPIPNTYTTLIENGNSSKAQFKMKIFSFVNNSVVYLHCKIRICMETPGSTCRTRCHAVRSLRAGETTAMHRTSWGPLRRSLASDLKREKEDGIGAGYITLITFAVLGFVLGVMSLLIFLYHRKVGRYNFRIKSDNFSYQVFYD